MAISRCSSCGNSGFEMKEQVPKYSAFRLLFVQCSSCGAVVGAMDFLNIGDMLVKQNAAIKRIGDRVGASTGL